MKSRIFNSKPIIALIAIVLVASIYAAGDYSGWLGALRRSEPQKVKPKVRESVQVPASRDALQAGGNIANLAMENLTAQLVPSDSDLTGLIPQELMPENLAPEELAALSNLYIRGSLVNRGENEITIKPKDIIAIVPNPAKALESLKNFENVYEYVTPEALKSLENYSSNEVLISFQETLDSQGQIKLLPGDKTSFSSLQPALDLGKLSAYIGERPFAVAAALKKQDDPKKSDNVDVQIVYPQTDPDIAIQGVSMNKQDDSTIKVSGYIVNAGDKSIIKDYKSLKFYLNGAKVELEGLEFTEYGQKAAEYNKLIDSLKAEIDQEIAAVMAFLPENSEKGSEILGALNGLKESLNSAAIDTQALYPFERARFEGTLSANKFQQSANVLQSLAPEQLQTFSVDALSNVSISYPQASDYDKNGDGKLNALNDELADYANALQTVSSDSQQSVAWQESADLNSKNNQSLSLITFEGLKLKIGSIDIKGQIDQDLLAAWNALLEGLGSFDGSGIPEISIPEKPGQALMDLIAQAGIETSLSQRTSELIQEIEFYLPEHDPLELPLNKVIYIPGQSTVEIPDVFVNLNALQSALADFTWTPVEWVELFEYLRAAILEYAPDINVDTDSFVSAIYDYILSVDQTRKQELADAIRKAIPDDSEEAKATLEAAAAAIEDLPLGEVIDRKKFIAAINNLIPSEEEIQKIIDKLNSLVPSEGVTLPDPKNVLAQIQALLPVTIRVNAKTVLNETVKAVQDKLSPYTTTPDLVTSGIYKVVCDDSDCRFYYMISNKSSATIAKSFAVELSIPGSNLKTEQSFKGINRTMIKVITVSKVDLASAKDELIAKDIPVIPLTLMIDSQFSIKEQNEDNNLKTILINVNEDTGAASL